MPEPGRVFYTRRKYGQTYFRWTERGAIALQAQLIAICGRLYDVHRTRERIGWRVEMWGKPE